MLIPLFVTSLFCFVLCAFECVSLNPVCLFPFVYSSFWVNSLCVIILPPSISCFPSATAVPYLLWLVHLVSLSFSTPAWVFKLLVFHYSLLDSSISLPLFYYLFYFSCKFLFCSLWQAHLYAWVLSYFKNDSALGQLLSRGNFYY